jgi:hypothetical protein
LKESRQLGKTIRRDCEPLPFKLYSWHGEITFDKNRAA